MQTKKLIISADDFGYSVEVNNAILSGIKDGIITSTGIITNFEAFDDAIERLPENTDIGVHLNIFEGKSMCGSKLLCDDNGNFKTIYPLLLLSQNNKKLLNDIEEEFRAQIEKVINLRPASHIDSHRHIHAVPAIFDITLKLAKEYGIKYIRTQNEPFYIAGRKVFDMKFPPNILKHVLLNNLTGINIKKLENTNVKTNDKFIGVLYTGYQDENSLLTALKYINEPVTEFIFHPAIPNDLKTNSKSPHYKEFLLTKTHKLKDKINEAGFELISFKNPD